MDNETEIIDFLRKNCPDAWHAWRRKNNHPTPDTLIGRTVRTLRPGFGGGSGEIRTIESYDKERNTFSLRGGYDNGLSISPFSLEVRTRGILDSLIPDIGTHSAWYLDLEPIPETIVVCLRGVPASGKSTLAKELEDIEKGTFAQFTRISADETGPNKWVSELKQAVERKDKYIVVDRCHTTEKQRARTIDALKEYGDRVVTILLTLTEVGFTELEQRIKDDVDHTFGVEKRLHALKCHMKEQNQDKLDAYKEGWGATMTQEQPNQLGPLWRLLRNIR